MEILLILCVAGLIWAISSRRKIDREEEISLKTPSRAHRLRENFGELIDLILSDPKHRIVFERGYDQSIRFANSHGQELFISSSNIGKNAPLIFVACTKYSQVIFEKRYDKRASTRDIFLEISDYFK